MEVKLEGEAELEVVGKHWICGEGSDQGLDSLADIGGTIKLVLGPAMGVGLHESWFKIMRVRQI